MRQLTLNFTFLLFLTVGFSSIANAQKHFTDISSGNYIVTDDSLIGIPKNLIDNSKDMIWVANTKGDAFFTYKDEDDSYKYFECSMSECVFPENDDILSIYNEDFLNSLLGSVTLSGFDGPSGSSLDWLGDDDFDNYAKEEARDLLQESNLNIEPERNPDTLEIMPEHQGNSISGHFDGWDVVSKTYEINPNQAEWDGRVLKLGHTSLINYQLIMSETGHMFLPFKIDDKWVYCRPSVHNFWPNMEIYPDSGIVLDGVNLLDKFVLFKKHHLCINPDTIKIEFFTDQTFQNVSESNRLIEHTGKLCLCSVGPWNYATKHFSLKLNEPSGQQTKPEAILDFASHLSGYDTAIVQQNSEGDYLLLMYDYNRVLAGERYYNNTKIFVGNSGYSKWISVQEFSGLSEKFAPSIQNPCGLTADTVDVVWYRTGDKLPKWVSPGVVYQKNSGFRACAKATNDKPVAAIEMTARYLVYWPVEQHVSLLLKELMKAGGGIYKTVSSDNVNENGSTMYLHRVNLIQLKE